MKVLEVKNTGNFTKEILVEGARKNKSYILVQNKNTNDWIVSSRTNGKTDANCNKVIIL